MTVQYIYMQTGYWMYMYLDLRHNIKFRLVVVLLNMHNASILVTMLLRDSN